MYLFVFLYIILRDTRENNIKHKKIIALYKLSDPKNIYVLDCI